MNVNDGGILIGYGSTDTNFKIFYGPADGTTTPPTPIDTGIAVPSTTTNYMFEISVLSASSIKVTIYNGQTFAQLYTNTIATNLPAGTKSLNFHNIIQNPTGANKTLTCYAGYMRCLK